jgi:hypothetical protein
MKREYMRSIQQFEEQVQLYVSLVLGVGCIPDLINCSYSLI